MKHDGSMPGMELSPAGKRVEGLNCGLTSSSDFSPGRMSNENKGVLPISRLCPIGRVPRAVGSANPCLLMVKAFLPCTACREKSGIE